MDSDPKRKGQQGRRFREGELATILAFAKLHGNRDAAKKFKLALRTIERHNGRLARNEDPELAALVGQKLAEAAQKHDDLLESALEAALQRSLKLMPRASLTEALQALEVLGDVKIKRDMFGGANAGASAARKDQTTRAPAAGDPRAPVVGGASPPGSEPVH